MVENLIAGPAIFTWPVLVAQLLIFGTAAFALMFAPLVPGDYDRRRQYALARTRDPQPGDVADGVHGNRLRDGAGSWLECCHWCRKSCARRSPAASGRGVSPVVVMLAIIVWIPARATLVALGARRSPRSCSALGSLTSHAIDKGLPMVAAYTLHQAGAGLWLGALVSLLMSARRGPAVLEAFAPRVSTVSAWSVGIMALSGPLIALRWLGWNPHLLVDSSYGRTLMVKIVIAAPVLLIGGYNRYWQMPRCAKSSVRSMLIRAVAAECVLLLAVLAWSAILANTPPPH